MRGFIVSARYLTHGWASHAKEVISYVNQGKIIQDEKRILLASIEVVLTKWLNNTKLIIERYYAYRRDKLCCHQTIYNYMVNEYFKQNLYWNTEFDSRRKNYGGYEIWQSHITS
jgi:hypothetical protein